MAETVLLPQQGNSVESVILLQWNKAEGDTVEIGDVLCEVETDKTTMEVESTAAGTILKQLFEAGDEVPVKTAIVVVGTPGESLQDFEGSSRSAEAAETPSPADASSSTAPAADASQSGTARQHAPSADAPSTGTAPPSGGTGVSGTAAAVSPRAKMKAATADLNSAAVASLAGTGPGGRVIERDVEEALRSGTFGAADKATAGAADGAAAAARAAGTHPAVTAAANAAVTAAVTEITEIPVQGIRKVIAERMRASLTSTAQFTLHGSADARTLQAMRARFKQEGSSLGLENVTINDMVMYAVARTLPSFPEMNAHFLEKVIRRFSRVDLSFAVDTERGLMVPTIPGADALSLRVLGGSIKELAGRCVSGKASAEDLAPGTFTVTNLGSFGVEYFTPVLNPPQVAILGINTISLKAVAGQDGSVNHVPHIGLSLTVDHQAVDGAPAARFLQELSRRIARIDLLLAV